MSEFTPINTQEEFNQRISQRLEEARNAERQKFADYETVKKGPDNHGSAGTAEGVES